MLPYFFLLKHRCVHKARPFGVDLLLFFRSTSRMPFFTTHEGKWLSVEYKNQAGQTTKYWLAIELDVGSTGTTRRCRPGTAKRSASAGSMALN